MKKPIAILFLALILFQLTGFLIVFKIKQNAIRKEIKLLIKNGVPENELFTIEFNSSNQMDFDWKHSKEFAYKGNMYDIVRTDTINQSTYLFYCVNDFQEKQLFANLDQIISHCYSEKSKSSDKQIDFSLLLTLKYLVFNTNFTFEKNPTLRHSNYWNNLYQSIAIKVNKQPPEFFII